MLRYTEEVIKFIFTLHNHNYIFLFLIQAHAHALKVYALISVSSQQWDSSLIVSIYFKVDQSDFW